MFDWTPALVPTSKMIPNSHDPPSTANAFIAGLSVMIGLSTIGFVARIFTKAWVMKKIQFEDYSLILGWAFYMVYQGFILSMPPYGLGRHGWNVTALQYSNFHRLMNYTEIFYCWCMLFTKLAILVQLRHIFRGTSRNSIWWLATILMITSTLYYIAGFITETAACIPRQKIWDPSVKGICLDNNTSIWISGIFNLVLDVLIFLLPIYAIWRLKMAVKRKVGIYATFAIGLLACVSSLLRLYASILLTTSQDETYTAGFLLLSAASEGASAILVASFPVMPRLYQYIRGNRWQHSSAGPSSGSEGAEGKVSYKNPDTSTPSSRAQSPSILALMVRKLGSFVRTPMANSAAADQIRAEGDSEVEGGRREEWVPGMRGVDERRYTVLAEAEGADAKRVRESKALGRGLSKGDAEKGVLIETRVEVRKI